LPHWDPDYCHKVAKWAAFVCFATLAAELGMFLFVTPTASCSNWATRAATTGQTTYLWLLATVWTGGATAGICYLVVRWREKFADRIYDRDDHRLPLFFRFLERDISEKGQEPDYTQILIDHNAGAVFGCSVWCLLGAIPLLNMIFECTDLPRYVWYY
jgi:hypothetical protein